MREERLKPKKERGIKKALRNQQQLIPHSPINLRAMPICLWAQQGLRIT